MFALILAAGQGTRLRPYTDNVPKGMVPFLGKPLLERQIETMQQVGISRIGLVGGYQAHCLPKNPHLVFNPDFHCTNMVYSMFCAKDLLLRQQQDVIISYADILYERRVLHNLIASESDFSVVVDKGWESLWQKRMDDIYTDVESLQVDSNDNITNLGQKVTCKGEVQGQYIGLIKIKRSALEHFFSCPEKLKSSATFKSCYMTDYLQSFIDLDIAVHAIYINNGWLEIDTVSDLKSYESLHANNKLHEIWDINR